jgi:hypothetical protein
VNRSSESAGLAGDRDAFDAIHGLSQPFMRSQSSRITGVIHHALFFKGIFMEAVIRPVSQAKMTRAFFRLTELESILSKKDSAGALE